MEHLTTEEKRNRLRIIPGVLAVLLVFFLAIQFSDVRNTTVTYEGLKIRLPFSAAMKKDKPDHTVYYDRVEDAAKIENAKSVSLRKADWDASRYEEMKQELISGAFAKHYGENDAETYRWVYALTDTGPEIFCAYILDPDSGNVWILESRRIEEKAWIKSLNTVRFTDPERS